MSRGTAPSQERSVIAHRRKLRYDNSGSIAVANILHEVSSNSYREFWRERYPNEDPPERATIPQLLGAYCYDPRTDRPRSYWTSALNRLEDVIDAQSRDCKESDWEDWKKKKYLKDLEELRAMTIAWYGTVEKDPKPQLLLEGNEGEALYVEHTDESSDPRHNSQPHTGLNLWDQRMREKIEQDTYDGMGDEGEGSSHT